MINETDWIESNMKAWSGRLTSTFSFAWWWRKRVHQVLSSGGAVSGGTCERRVVTGASLRGAPNLQAIHLQLFHTVWSRECQGRLHQGGSSCLQPPPPSTSSAVKTRRAPLHGRQRAAFYWRQNRDRIAPPVKRGPLAPMEWQLGPFSGDRMAPPVKGGPLAPMEWHTPCLMAEEVKFMIHIFYTTKSARFSRHCQLKTRLQTVVLFVWWSKT